MNELQWKAICKVYPPVALTSTKSYTVHSVFLRYQSHRNLSSSTSSGLCYAVC